MISFDLTQNCYVKGINFLTAFYVTGKAGLSVTFDLVTKTETSLDAKTGQRTRRK